MTIEELKDLLSRITYKPGSTISACSETPETVRLSFEILVPDVEKSVVKCVKLGGSSFSTSYELAGPGTHIMLQRFLWLHTLSTEEQVTRFISHAWKELEAHEVDEWLKLDGEPVTEPHPELRAEALSRDPNCAI